MSCARFPRFFSPNALSCANNRLTEVARHAAASIYGKRFKAIERLLRNGLGLRKIARSLKVSCTTPSPA
jgi:hypothetical protein